MTRIPSYQFQRLLEQSPIPERELAELVDVSQATISRWRRGESTPSIGHVDDVARIVRHRANKLYKTLLALEADLEDFRRIVGMMGS